MPKMIQVRNVPEKLHRELARRAKACGQTLTDYIQDLLERETARPPADEVFDRIESRTKTKLKPRAAALVHEGRAGRSVS